MASLRIRGAIALAAVLSLALSTAAAADTITADGDTVTTGAQTTVHLGVVEVGQTRDVDVDFVLACRNSSHVAAGTTVGVELSGLIVPGDGSVDVSPGSIDVPATWPASGEACPTDATVTSATPAHVAVTAPSTTGTNLEFDVFFAPVPDTGAVTNFTAISIKMDVVESGPTDATPPVLHDVPDSMAVTTSDDSAIVTWPLPTATDDTDADPNVACAPDSGSTFALGTTAVTCTAVDASGNQASAEFDVTVVHVPRLDGRWGRPLDDALPALVGRAGRTVPLRLDVTADGVEQGPVAIDPPTLTISALAACTTDAAARSARSAGTFAWGSGTWQLNLQTGDLGHGCWRLDARVGGTTFATAVIRLEGGGVAVAAHRR